MGDRLPLFRESVGWSEFKEQRGEDWLCEVMWCGGRAVGREELGFGGGVGEGDSEGLLSFFWGFG